MSTLLYSSTSELQKILTKNITAMSQKNKMRRAKREERQEQQAKMVIRWIFGALILLALISLVVFMIQQM